MLHYATFVLDLEYAIYLYQILASHDISFGVFYGQQDFISCGNDCSYEICIFTVDLRIFWIYRSVNFQLANTIINYSVAMYQLKPEDWNDEDRGVPQGKNPTPVHDFMEFLRLENGTYFSV